MIDFLRGSVAAVNKDNIVLDVSGFGVKVFPTKSVFSRAVVGDELTCLTWLQISEAGLTMYGFANETERRLFHALKTVNSVGGKLSISLLRSLDVARIIDAIRKDNPSVLHVPGLGATKAGNICRELKHKIERDFSDVATESSTGGADSFDSFVTDALVGLGFSHGESARAIATAKAQSDETVWTEESLLMASLGILQRGQGIR